MTACLLYVPRWRRCSLVSSTRLSSNHLKRPWCLPSHRLFGMTRGVNMPSVASETPHVPTLTVRGPSSGDVYVFRIPSLDEYQELLELHETGSYVGTRPPLIDWLSRHLILRVNSKREHDIDFGCLERDDAQAIRRAVRGMLQKRSHGRCCVCGALTPSTVVTVCDACFGHGWSPARNTDSLHTELGMARLLGTSRWARRGDQISYLDSQSRPQATTEDELQDRRSLIHSPE